MHLGEARRADRVAVVLADQRRQLGGGLQAAGVGLPLGLAARRIAAQGEHVLDPGVADLVQDLAQALDRLAYAAEMGHRLDSQVLLDPLRDLHRALARAASRAVGDRDEVRTQVAERGQRLAQGHLSLRRLRREELEREDGLGRGLDDLVDAHERESLDPRGIQPRDLMASGFVPPPVT
jgi:hypothetical protein